MVMEIGEEVVTVVFASLPIAPILPDWISGEETTKKWIQILPIKDHQQSRLCSQPEPEQEEPTLWKTCLKRLSSLSGLE